MCIHMCVCVYVCIYIYILHINIYIYIYNIYKQICMYVYICIYIYILKACDCFRCSTAASVRGAGGRREQAAHQFNINMVIYT